MKKMKKQGGFTLVEMLIVVAIIAILIAISIPLVNNALERARDATDDANFRAAAGLGTIAYLAAEKSSPVDGTYFYYTNTASQGALSTDGNKSVDGTTLTGYTKYTSQCTGSDHGTTNTSSGKTIQVVIGTDGAVTVSWE